MKTFLRRSDYVLFFCGTEDAFHCPRCWDLMNHQLFKKKKKLKNPDLFAG